MGSNSSQIEQTQGAQVLKEQAEGYHENEDAHFLSDADSKRSSGTNKTSASRALARELERSVMESSQEYLADQPPKKRRKRKSAQPALSIVEEAPDLKVDEPAVTAAQSEDKQSVIDEDEEMTSQQSGSAVGSPSKDQSTARKHLVRDLRRMKKTMLVSSGKAKWAPRTNGAKWEVEKLPPGQWPKRKLTDVEEQTVARYKAKVKEAKQRLKDFDSNAAQTVTVREDASSDRASEEGELAAATPISVTNEVLNGGAAVMEEPEDSVQAEAARKLIRKERKKQRRAQLKSRQNADDEVQVETTEPSNAIQPQPESAPELEEKPQKKRKRSQPQKMVSSPPETAPKPAIVPDHEEEQEAKPDRQVQQADRPRKRRKQLQPQAMTSSPPQQHKPDQVIPPLRSVAGKHKTEFVKSWLSGQIAAETIETPASTYDAEVSAQSRKRKRVSRYQEDDDADFQVASQEEEEEDDMQVDSDEELPTFKPAPESAAKAGESNRPKKSVQSKKPPKSRDLSQPPPTTSKGPFTAEEKSLADSIFSRVLQDEGIDEATLKHKISTWRTVGAFKEEIETALPARDKPSVRKFCQRRYHMQERGAWTTEQDDDLRTAQANYPDKWRKHQDIVGRTAADCKDRWTMHLQFSKKTGAWTQEEENNLAAAVEAAVDKIRNDSETDPDLAADCDALENALSWKVIAEELGNTRSYKQCREKWEKLKLRGKKSDDRAPRDSLNPTSTAKKNSTLAKRVVQTFEIGDFYDIFVEIHTSFDDTSQRYHDEDNVLWSIISMKNPASRFGLSYMRGGVLRRAALEHALNEWNIDSKKVRRRLEKAETFPAKAMILAKLLEKSYAGRLHAMSRTFMPEMIGKSEKEILDYKEERRSRLAEKRKLKAPPKVKQSKEFVEHSDEEESELEDAPTPAIDDGNDDDDEDDGSGKSHGNDKQSVRQRRLESQLNGREADFEEEIEPEVDESSVDGLHEADIKMRSSRPNNLEDSRHREESVEAEDAAELEDNLIKKEESDDSSGSMDDVADVEHDSVKDAGLLRRFDAAIAERRAAVPSRTTANAAPAPSTPVSYDSESSDEGEKAPDAFSPFPDIDIKMNRHSNAAISGSSAAAHQRKEDFEDDEQDDDDDDETDNHHAASLDGAGMPVVSRSKFIKRCRGKRRG